MEDFSIYVHIPFCRHRCAYCDFNTYAGQESLIPAYVDALRGEIRQAAEKYPSGGAKEIPIHSIFFGGGTPSLLDPDQVASVIGEIRDCFFLREDAEISLEANPGTISPAYLAELRRTGVNRLSMGMQSAREEELRLIDRLHGFEDVIQSVARSRRAGFENISLDLLFAIPGQKLEDWQFSLERALDLKTEHLSLYSLTIEEGTPFHRWMEQGRFVPTDEDLAADMMELAEERLEKEGFDHYEISNWARRSEGHRFECRHNLQYWRNRPYFGFGAGAHGCLGGFRTANTRGIGDYIQSIARGGKDAHPFGAATVERSELTLEIEMQETLMVGLRLTREGVSRKTFQDRFGRDLGQVFGPQIRKLVGQGLLEWIEDGASLRLTRRGRFLGNRVFMEFVGQG